MRMNVARETRKTFSGYVQPRKRDGCQNCTKSTARPYDSYLDCHEHRIDVRKLGWCPKYIKL